MPKVVWPIVNQIGLYETLQAVIVLMMVGVALVAAARPIAALDRLETFIGRVARRPYVALGFVVALSVGGPLALRPLIGFPDPIIPDEFSMDLQAKTYLRGLFANDPLSPNFEALWTNLTPTYASQYPALRSLPLLIGYATGLGAWGGVLLTVALMPLAVLWMTRQWLGPGYALVAALLVTLRFGLFSHWANSYFGAHVAALGGVLLVGGYKVLRSRPNLLGGAAFGAGAVLIMMTRPYEGLWFATPLAAAVAGDFLRSDRTLRAALVAPALVAAVLAAGGVGLTAASNQAITGDWKLFPNVLQREEMGTAPLLLVQTWRPPASDRTRYDWLRRNMEHEKVQYLRRNSARDVVVAEGERFANSWTFYLGFSLILPFVLGLWPLRREPALVLAAGLLGVGLALETFDSAHYAAPAFGFIMLSVMLGFRSLRRWAPQGRPFGLALSRTLPLALVVGAAVPLSAAAFGFPHFPNWGANALNTSCCWLWPRSLHSAVNAKLAQLDEPSLVIADTGPQWPYVEAPIANDADLDAAKTIWINEDPEFDRATIERYPGRRVWRVRWLETGEPCLQEFRSVTSAPGAPLMGDRDALVPDPARGWLPAPADACPGGLTRQPWSVSTKR